MASLPEHSSGEDTAFEQKQCLPLSASLQNFRATKTSKYLVITVACVAMFLDNANVTGLVFALPGLSSQFHAGENETGWTLSAYSLTFGSFLLLLGRCGDIFGYRLMFVGGIALFSLCVLLAATITSSLIGLCVIRAFQGIAAAATIPNAYALVATTVEGRAREMAVAFVGIAQCLGVVAGTILGGVFVTTSVNYRGTFWLSLGLSVICLVVATIVIPPSHSQFTKWKSLDYMGSILITIAALLLVFGFSEGSNGWRQGKVISTIILGGLGVFAFFFYEEYVLPRWFKSVEPLVPRRVWAYKNFLPILANTALFYAAFFSLQLNGAQFLVKVQQRSSIIASVYFIPIACGAAFCMPFLSTFYNHRFMPPKWVIAFGQALLMTGVLLFSRNDLNTSYWHWTFPGFLLVPIGASSFFVNFLNMVFSSAPPEEQGLISGIAQTAAQVMTALGFSIAGSFVGQSDDREILKNQFKNSFYFTTSLAAANVVIAAVFLRPIPHRDVKKEDQPTKVNDKGEPDQQHADVQSLDPENMARRRQLKDLQPAVKSCRER